MKRIGLYGIGGVYNFGCEAIVRGAVKLISRLYEEVEIFYFSKNYEYDKQILEDLDIHIVDVSIKRKTLDRINNRICRMVNANKRPLFVNFDMMMSLVDDIWSIGGDLYTIPEVKRSREKYSYYNHIVDFCSRAQDCKKNVILYGASIGPFGKYKTAIDYYINALEKYNLILCRERVSLQYLESFRIKNVLFFPDPAFQVHLSEPDFDSEKKYIGINLSPLSLNEIYGGNNVDNQKKMARLIMNIIEQYDSDILFVPHVISSSIHDDDLRFQKKLLSIIDEQYQDRIRIANINKGFFGVKAQLRQCKYILSARMHCAINAIVENVPAIFLTYSSKSVGMADYVYGNQNWVVKLNRIESDLDPVINKMDEQYTFLSYYLKKRNCEISEEYESLLQVLMRELGLSN